MSNLKLEVGKSYINGNGSVVKIVEFSARGSYPYRDDDGLIYSEDGRYDIDGLFPELNLGEEVKSKVSITDYVYSQCSTTAEAYVPHQDVEIHELPEKIDQLTVVVDNGRLGISVNGRCIFYTSSLADGVVTIER